MKFKESFKEDSDRRFVDFCTRYIKPGHSVIEVGPGAGEFAELLHKKIMPENYEFIDIVDQRAYKKEFKFEKIDIDTEKFYKQDSSVDIIIVSQVVEHLKNPTHFFNESYRVLKENGLLIMKFPNYSNIYQRIKFLYRGIPNRFGGKLNSGGHINFLPYKWVINFTKGYYDALAVEGDICVDTLLRNLLFFISKKKRFLVGAYNKNLNFSWNVMMCLKKEQYG